MSADAKMKNRVLIIGIYPSTDFGLAPLTLAAKLTSDPAVSSEAAVTARSYKVEESSQVLSDIVALAPRIIGLSCYMWNIERMLEIAAGAKRELKSCTIIVGGPEFLSPEITLQRLWPKHSCVDYVVLGEGEETLTELVLHIMHGGTAPEDIMGIAFRGEDGSVRITGERPAIADLDHLASPYRYLSSLGLDINEFDGYESSRGCTKRCAYCAWNRGKGRTRFLSPNRIQEDLKELAGIGAINFLDSAVNLEMNRFRELVGVLRQVQLSSPEILFSFFLEVFSETDSDELCRCLEGLNIGTLWFGIQTTSEVALRLARRRWWKSRVFSSFVRQLCERLPQIRIGFDLIYGLPGDDYDSHRESVQFAMSLMPDVLQSKHLSIVPGSEFFERPGKYGIRFDEHPPYHLIECDTFSREDMERAEILSRKLNVFYEDGELPRLLYQAASNTGRPSIELFEELIPESV